jgi:hypothetical protein
MAKIIVSFKKDKKMTKKYSSFKQQHMITENFRKFMNEEGDDEEYNQADARGAGAITAVQQAIINFINNDENEGTLEKNATAIVDITKLNNDDAWQVLKDEGIFDAVAADFIEAGVKNPDGDDIGNAIQNWIASRGLTSDGEIDYGEIDSNQLQESKKTNKVTKSQLTKIIKEEIRKTLSEEETAPGLMHIAPDQRAFWIFDMWIPESVEEMQKIVKRRASGARFRGTMDTLPDVIRSEFTNWAYDEARDKMGSEWEGDEDGWEDAVEALGYKREELLSSDELLGKIKEILKWDDRRWVDAGLSVAPNY